jgi:hypothetical protein
MATSQTGIQNVFWNPGNTGYDPTFPLFMPLRDSLVPL